MGSRLSKILAMFMVIAMLGMSIGFMMFLLDEVINNGTGAVMVGMLGLGGVVAMMCFGPIGRAVASMLEGGTPRRDDPMLGMRVADLEDRLQEISLETQRLTELEERLDFAERLLTRQSDATSHGGE